MMSPRLHIRTSSRLHFGLLGWGPEVVRQFGGIGLMIDSPAIELTVEPAGEWIAEGLLAARVDLIITQIRERLLESSINLPPARVRVESAPAEHVGLGVGTQLSLAVARAILKLGRLNDPPVSELARLTGRGGRSGIGLHGFHHGGLIVDGGRKREAEIPPLLARTAFPDQWSILIVQPPGVRGLHGIDERDAFAKLPPISRNAVEVLCRLVLLEILPAVIENDLQAFGAALGELQERVGAAFAPAQGGIYATPQAAEIVRELKRLGFAGAGQSSWGPTLYAFSDIPREDIEHLALRLCGQFGLDRSSVFCTKAANQGALMEVGWV
jgi:beta-ribofuranosylaminobenzene 5'-phosphate synthase